MWRSSRNINFVLPASFWENRNRKLSDRLETKVGVGGASASSAYIKPAGTCGARTHARRSRALLFNRFPITVAEAIKVRKRFWYYHCNNRYSHRLNIFVLNRLYVHMFTDERSKFKKIG